LIVTFTANPAVDKTVQLKVSDDQAGDGVGGDNLQSPGLNRVDVVSIDAGGKGINVSKTIHALGGDTLATGFLAGNTGRFILDNLNELGIKSDFIEISGNTRTNLKVLGLHHELTEINESGPKIGYSFFDQMAQKLLDYSQSATVILSGTLAAADSNRYAEILAQASSANKFFVDTSGQALIQAVKQKPFLIKPNDVELSELVGYPGHAELSIGQYASICAKIVAEGIAYIILSLGSKGAIFVSSELRLYAPKVDVEVKSTVGAGDSMLAGFAYAFDRGLPFEQAAQYAVATASAAVSTPGTKPPLKSEVERLLPLVKIAPVQE
jgi:1-phosphofructokinase